ncbi:unnamed protein product [Cyclocybe aegerita]|uniref:Uncharacterized protein n=1 Tax=Cyclocybe aegerita TaxID=1973307 RepID=A0A8S0WGC0_CYCAE|nr:unnamed protein product [Cyclocybe aegerita]
MCANRPCRPQSLHLQNQAGLYYPLCVSPDTPHLSMHLSEDHPPRASPLVYHFSSVNRAIDFYVGPNIWVSSPTQSNKTASSFVFLSRHGDLPELVLLIQKRWRAVRLRNKRLLWSIRSLNAGGLTKTYPMLLWPASHLFQEPR